MDRDSFIERLTRASEFCRDFAKTLVFDPLPDAFRYFVSLNSSYDGNPLREGEITFPGDLEKYGANVGPIDADEVARLLWRDRKVPEWIDISVCRADQQNTYVELVCCGRFSGLEDQLYYSWNDQPGLPVASFGIKGPPYPLRLALAVLDGQVEKYWLAESRPDREFGGISMRPG